MSALRWILMVSVPVAALGAWFLLPPSSSSRSGATSAGAADTPATPHAGAEAEPPKERPIATLETAEHNFGAMDSLQRGNHAFVIRNTGNADLQLRDGGTTCKCTLSEIPPEPIPPGGEARITLNWLTTPASKYYSQTANILTNDPQNRHIMLRVFGTVRNRVVIEPGSVVFSKLEPDSNATTELLIFSELWPRFEVRDLACSLPGFRCEVAPVAPPPESGLTEGSCYRLRVTSPDDLPEGHFQGILSFRAVPGVPEARPQLCEVSVSGKVMRRLSVYGQAINSLGEVELGTIDAGQGREVNLLMKVRDAEKSLPIERVDVRPDFVAVKVEADNPAAAERGLYRLRIRVPADAPPCDYLGERAGKLQLAVDHPRISGLTLKLKFAVVQGLQASTPHPTSAKRPSG